MEITMAMERFANICKCTQSELKAWLEKELVAIGYDTVENGDGYLYVKGSLPVLLTAHMDTVHKVQCKDIYLIETNQGSKIYSNEGVGGDDRCGIFMALEIAKQSEIKPTILFCEDEEIGRVGADKFCDKHGKDYLSHINYMIELDRAGNDDAVFYECDNKEFTKFITETTGYKERTGSYSDISSLMPHFGIAGVNFSCGYYNAHTTSEYVIWEEMLNTIDVVMSLISVESKKYEFVEKVWSYNSWKGGYANWYKYGLDYDDYEYEYSYARKKSKEEIYDGGKRSETNFVCSVSFVDENGVENWDMTEGRTKEEAFLEFFYQNPDVTMNMIIEHSYELC